MLVCYIFGNTVWRVVVKGSSSPDPGSVGSISQSNKIHLEMSCQYEEMIKFSCPHSADQKHLRLISQRAKIDLNSVSIIFAK